MGARVETEFEELRTTCYDTITNYQFSQKLKPLQNYKLNHLIIIPTYSNNNNKQRNKHGLSPNFFGAGYGSLTN